MSSQENIPPKFSRAFWIVVLVLAAVLVAAIVVANASSDDGRPEPCILTEDQREAGDRCQ